MPLQLASFSSGSSLALVPSSLSRLQPVPGFAESAGDLLPAEIQRLLAGNRAGLVPALPAGAPERSMTIQAAPKIAELTPEKRAKLAEQEKLLRSVWHQWKEFGLTFDSAVLAESCNVEKYPILSTAGKNGGSAIRIATVHNWFDKRLGWKRDRTPDWDNIEGLIDNWKPGRSGFGGDPEFLKRVIQLWLSPGTRTVASCWKCARDEFYADGMARVVSPFERVKAYVERTISKQTALKARASKDYRNLMKGYIRRNKNFGPNEVWFCDHRQVDFWVRIPHPTQADKWICVRPYVTAIQDGFSGKLLAYVLYADQYPNHQKIIEAFEVALRTAGNRAPRYIYTDQGNDFLMAGVCVPRKMMTKKGELLHRDGNPFAHCILIELGAEHIMARGYNGREKPVERLFRDASLDFDKMQIGYCGNNPTTRPDYGETWEGDVMRLPSEWQVLEETAAWVARHNGEPSAGRPSPDTLWSAADFAAWPVMSDAKLFLSLLLPAKLCPEVGRSAYGFGGVTYHGWQYSHRALRDFDNGRGLMGEAVCLKTWWAMPQWTDDRGRRHPLGVFLFTPAGQFICFAEAEQTAALVARTPEEHKQLGKLAHVIAFASQLDKAELERLTGSDRVHQSLPRLERTPITADGAVALGEPTQQFNRRVKAAVAGKAEDDGPGGRRASGAVPPAADPDTVSQLAAFLRDRGGEHEDGNQSGMAEDMNSYLQNKEETV